MESRRFDLFTRRLSTRLSRRGAIGVLVGGAAAAASAGASAADPARTTCRAANAICRTNAQCCSGLCDTRVVAHRTRRNRCGCHAPLTPCGSQCVDTQTSERNCGACGRRCTDGQICRNGACVPPSCAGSDATICFATAEGTIIELDHACIGEILIGCQSGLTCERRLAELVAIEDPTLLYFGPLQTACVIGGTRDGAPLEPIPPDGICAIFVETWDEAICR